MSSLLDQLMAQFQAPTTTVGEAKENLTPDAPVTFEGVNAPEFEDPMEAQFEAQQARMRPEPNDGLEDDDIPLTSEHIPAEVSLEPVTTENLDVREPEVDHLQVLAATSLPDVVIASDVQSSVNADTVIESPTLFDHEQYRAAKLEAHNMAELVVYEDLPWFQKPWNARFLNLSRRTRNALHASHLRNMSDLRFSNLASLKKLKGFGKKALDELNAVYEDLAGQLAGSGEVTQLKHSGIETLYRLSLPDSHHSPEDIELNLTLDDNDVHMLEEYKRHFRDWFDFHPTLTDAPHQEVEERSQPVPMTQEQCDDLMAQNPLPAEPEPEPDVETVEESPVVEIEVGEESPVSVQARLKILVIGSSVTAHREGLVTQTLEKAYAHHIEGILKQVKVPSLGMVDYGKGWAMLGAAIRDQGWPEGIDVLHVNDCYRGKAELMMELHPIADLVVMS